MEISTILNDFKGTAPIFPLPDFVMFPKVGKAFKIFEPRYISMVKDAICGDKLICVTQLKPGWRKNYNFEPKIFQIGTLNYIFKYEESKNDNHIIIYTFGIKKVQIFELEKSHLYRKAQLTLIDDNTIVSSESDKKESLIKNFASIANISMDNKDLDFFQGFLTSTEMIVNTICHTLPILPIDKQNLLELSDISLRLDVIMQYMDSQAKVFNKDEDLIDFLPIDPTWN